ncbi:hypothetical protein [Parapedobacter tibetensis]|uniref:hypothetical protein n=1 Tax=Parapedobacter tibetensis TaxID=2972951 RepID=UPI00214DE652|nr:hypothetical protein [Parapedobacter tibetensis]
MRILILMILMIITDCNIGFGQEYTKLLREEVMVTMDSCLDIRCLDIRRSDSSLLAAGKYDVELDVSIRMRLEIGQSGIPHGLMEIHRTMYITTVQVDDGCYDGEAVERTDEGKVVARFGYDRGQLLYTKFYDDDGNVVMKTDFVNLTQFVRSRDCMNGWIRERTVYLDEASFPNFSEAKPYDNEVINEYDTEGILRVEDDGIKKAKKTYNEQGMLETHRYEKRISSTEREVITKRFSEKGRFYHEVTVFYVMEPEVAGDTVSHYNGSVERYLHQNGKVDYELWTKDGYNDPKPHQLIHRTYTPDGKLIKEEKEELVVESVMPASGN